MRRPTLARSRGRREAAGGAAARGGPMVLGAPSVETKSPPRVNGSIEARDEKTFTPALGRGLGPLAPHESTTSDGGIICAAELNLTQQVHWLVRDAEAASALDTDLLAAPVAATFLGMLCTAPHSAAARNVLIETASSLASPSAATLRDLLDWTVQSTSKAGEREQRRGSALAALRRSIKMPGAAPASAAPVLYVLHALLEIAIKRATRAARAEECREAACEAKSNVLNDGTTAGTTLGALSARTSRWGDNRFSVLTEGDVVIDNEDMENGGFDSKSTSKRCVTPHRDESRSMKTGHSLRSLLRWLALVALVAFVAIAALGSVRACKTARFGAPTSGVSFAPQSAVAPQLEVAMEGNAMRMNTSAIEVATSGACAHVENYVRHRDIHGAHEHSTQMSVVQPPSMLNKSTIPVGLRQDVPSSTLAQMQQVDAILLAPQSVALPALWRSEKDAENFLPSESTIHTSQCTAGLQHDAVRSAATLQQWVAPTAKNDGCPELSSFAGAPHHSSSKGGHLPAALRAVSSSATAHIVATCGGGDRMLESTTSPNLLGQLCQHR